MTKKTLEMQTESRNRYESKKQHAERLKEMEVMRLNHASQMEDALMSKL